MKAATLAIAFLALLGISSLARAVQTDLSGNSALQTLIGIFVEIRVTRGFSPVNSREVLGLFSSRAMQRPPHRLRHFCFLFQWRIVRSLVAVRSR